jgi:hypothetical protein
VLRHEWVNARGAIARFDRGTIEIRVLDAQECPAADIAVAAAVTAAVRVLAEQVTSNAQAQNRIPTEALAEILGDTVREGDGTHIRHRPYLALFGWKGPVPCPASALWRELVRRYLPAGPDAARWGAALDVIVEEGCLARRILALTGPQPGPETLLAASHTLVRCLETGGLLRRVPPPT